MLNDCLGVYNATFQRAHTLNKLGDQLHHEDHRYLVDNHHRLGAILRRGIKRYHLAALELLLELNFIVTSE